MLIQKATESCVSRKTGLVELEIWMEWQLGQSSINQFLFVNCVYVVYACDAQTNCIKILTSLKQTAEFFNALGEIYKAFSVHERHLAYRLPSIQEAVGLVSDTLQLLHRNETSIRGEVANLPKTLNGPHVNNIIIIIIIIILIIIIIIIIITTLFKEGNT